MCKPIWHNIRRTTLYTVSAFQVGQEIKVWDPNFSFGTYTHTMLEKITCEGGLLMIVRYVARWDNFKPVIGALWSPTYGGGGWVDLPKDPTTDALCQVWREAELARQAEQQALNCMAL